MNRVILVGRLARDPELRTTGTGKSVTSFTVAVDRRVNRNNQNSNQPTADFINCVAWDRQGEVINQYFRKGNRIALEGRLSTRSYDAQDGSKRYVTEVIMDTFDFIESKGESQQSQGFAPRMDGGGYNAPNRVEPAPSNATPIELDDDFHLMADDDEVPF